MRHYYAEFSPCGIHTMSDGDRLMRFDSTAERDEIVERINAAHYDKPEGVARAVTTREVAHRYNIHNFNTDYEHEGGRTFKGKIYFEIEPRY